MARRKTSGCDVAGKCCRIIIGKILSAIVIVVVLGLRQRKPKCYISTLTAPSLNTPTTNDSTITLLVDFNNVNQLVGVKYDNVNITVGVFLDRNTTSPIGSSTIEGFYQECWKTARKLTSVEAHAGALNRTVKVDGKRYFRVDFATWVKYKTGASYSRRHRLWGGANVAVNDAGFRDESDSIRLGHYFPVIVPSSGAPPAGFYGILLLMVLFHFTLYF